MDNRRTITTTGKFNMDTLPFRLYQKAKKFGVWDPREIDFSEDVKHWESFTQEQRDGLLSTIAKFQGGEEAVTLDLLPLIMVVAKEGRLDEEMFLTTFLFEEAKHTEFFRLFLDAVGEKNDLEPHLTKTWHKIFNELLPNTMNRLLTDQSPEAVADAAVLYNMFVEGVLAETGYYSFYASLEKAGLLPGLLKGIGLLKRDESRHIGYGTYLLQRLICENPHLYEHVEKRMEELAPLAFDITTDGAEPEGDESAFGVPFEETTAFMTKQLSVRMEILKRAKGKKIEDIYKTTESEVGVL